MIATALYDAMTGEAGRTIGLTGHPFLSMYVMNLGDRPALLIDVELPAGTTIEDGQGFDVVEISRSGRKSVLIRPSRSGVATPAFVGLAEFVYRETGAVATRAAAIVALIDSVHEFRQFFARRNDRLSESALRGLFAELELLIALVKAGMAPMDALLAWCGPYLGVDFKFANGAAIEVKSARVPAKAVQISSEYQLETSSGSLHLFVRPLSTVAAEDTVGMRLVDIVSSAKSVVTQDGGALELWESAMEAVGFDGADVYYEKWRFTSDEWQAYEVTDGFPRVIQSDLPTGVRAVTYTLQLDAAEPFRKDSETTLNQIAGQYA
ncbi:PD-(D/E)XK motif protein (plasmid) [Coraliomargarita sp. W4R53]